MLRRPSSVMTTSFALRLVGSATSSTRPARLSSTTVSCTACRETPILRASSEIRVPPESRCAKTRECERRSSGKPFACSRSSRPWSNHLKARRRSCPRVSLVLARSCRPSDPPRVGHRLLLGSRRAGRRRRGRGAGTADRGPGTVPGGGRPLSRDLRPVPRADGSRLRATDPGAAGAERNGCRRPIHASAVPRDERGGLDLGAGGDGPRVSSTSSAATSATADEAARASRVRLRHARSPNGVRTRVSTLRGWCPRPLDDGTARPGRGRAEV